MVQKAALMGAPIVLGHAGRNLGGEAAAVDRQREGALHLSQARTQREQTMHLAGSEVK